MLIRELTLLFYELALATSKGNSTKQYLLLNK
jgi:hypothetical protein